MSKRYATWVPACSCRASGVIKRADGRIVCRWCRRPYKSAGFMHYERQAFKAPYGVPVE